MSLEWIVRKASAYGSTKRGRDRLDFRGLPDGGLRVVASSGDLARVVDITAAELAELTLDEAMARACDVVDRALHELRELMK